MSSKRKKQHKKDKTVRYDSGYYWIFASLDEGLKRQKEFEARRAQEQVEFKTTPTALPLLLRMFDDRTRYTLGLSSTVPLCTFSPSMYRTLADSVGYERPDTAFDANQFGYLVSGVGVLSDSPPIQWKNPRPKR